MGDSVIELGELRAELLAVRMRELLADAARRKQKLKQLAAELSARADENTEIAISALERGNTGIQPIPPDVIELLRIAVMAQLNESDQLKRRGAERDRESRAALEAAHREQECQKTKHLIELHQREKELSTLQQQKADLTELLNAARQESQATREELETARTELEATHEELKTTLSRLEGAETHAALQAKNLHDLRVTIERTEKSLSVHRSQRAWTVMLIVRKAYSLLLREGWRGRIRFLPWAAGLLVGRTGDLAPYEPEIFKK
jgi:hypothetical protein